MNKNPWDNGPDARIAKALESIARSLERIAYPPQTANMDLGINLAHMKQGASQCVPEHNHKK